MRPRTKPLSARIVCLPMHGEVKLRSDGLRTRDAHLIEWMSRMIADITVLSRPEPFPRLSLSRLRGRRPRLDASLVSPEVWAPTALARGRRWWSASRRWLPPIHGDGAIVSWSPFAAAHYLESTPRPMVFDFLDDWLIHDAFASLRGEIDECYRLICGEASVVYCNSEGTLARAHAYGRDDALLVSNGCDPDRFDPHVTPSTEKSVIGYAGKLGGRLDFDLIQRAANALPNCEFVLAGPLMDRRTRDQVARLDGVRYVGDIHYDSYPELLSSFDIGWVPHRIGKGEVGGDAIKLYEYRAAGLPAFSTPIIGAGRLSGVRVATRAELLDRMAAHVAASDVPRIDREPLAIPAEHTWRHKAQQFVASLEALRGTRR